jgi:soluble lytic murein transglycosylase-like protein
MGRAGFSNCYDFFFVDSCRMFFEHVIDWHWLKAQSVAESNLDPTAVSPAGALGVMQLMPETGKEMARRLGVDYNPWNPAVNITLGVAYARRCWDIWKAEKGVERIRYMLGSYNAGPGHIIKAQRLAAAGGLPDDRWSSIAQCLPDVTGRSSKETIDYVARVERYWQQMMVGGD